uniref:Integrase catalytic domain-containing protein n=1 Tax=Hucho hucho TaxID=62062 RepID=A0A4W5P1G0_9TELE
MTREVRSFVQACPVCAQQKSSNQRPAGLLHPLPIPQRPWSHISMDFVTGLPASEGNTVVLVVVDRFSKAAHFIPLPKLPSAKETADLILQNVVRIHGTPVDIVSDRGPQFMSRYWKAFWSLLGSSVSLSSGFHPQSNGQTEWINQELEKYLCCFTSHQPSSWSRFLLWAELAHNTLRSSSTGLSPFKCQFGFKPPLFFSQEIEVGVPNAERFVKRCRRTWKRAHAALKRASARHKRSTDKRRRATPHYRIGQRVWLSAKDLPLKVESKKLAPRFVGPFKITSRVNPVAYRLALPRSLRVRPTFHVSRLKPVLTSLVSPSSHPSRPPLVL